MQLIARSKVLSLVAMAPALSVACAISSVEGGEDSSEEAVVAGSLAGQYSQKFSPSGYADGDVVHLDVRAGGSETTYQLQLVDGAKCGLPCTAEKAQVAGSIRVESGTLATGSGRSVTFRPNGGGSHTATVTRRANGFVLTSAGHAPALLVAATTSCTTSGDCGLRQRCAAPLCERERPTDKCPPPVKSCSDLGSVSNTVTVGAACARDADCAAPAACEPDPGFTCDRERESDRCPPAPKRCVTRAF